MHIIVTKIRVYAFLVITIFCFLNCSCDKKTVNILKDKQIASFQDKLIDIAFETATAIPVDPHIKARSRVQEEVFDVCLKLDQPKKADSFIKSIDNWRKGSCYAKLALYCAENGYLEDAHLFLFAADEIASQDHGQDWRNNRIRAKIDQARMKLNLSKPSNLESEEEFDQLVEMIDMMAETGEFDALKNSLNAYAQLFNRYYENEQRCLFLEDKIRTTWIKLPAFIRTEVLFNLVEFALEHSDKEKALELVNEAQLFLDESKWPIKNYLPMAVKLASLRYKSDDIKRAYADVDAAFAIFNSQKSEIADIYRAQAIRPIGRAYQLMNKTTAALSVYKQAIEEGIENPNSRPRAEDLSATCSDMALYAVEPNAELWKRIYQISEGLGQPW